MKKIRIGLVGTGTIAHIMHLPGIATMREMGLVDLVAVADMFPEKALAAAEKFDVEAHYGSLDQMLARADFELLVNNTPIPQHYEVTLAALRAGRHVYTQKPMTTTVAEATHLIDEARERKLTLAVAPEHPVRPMIKRLATLIADGAIGKVTFARVVSSHDGPEKHDVPRDSTWFYKPGSSPILDLGVHGLSQITAIVGPVRRVTCVSGRSQDVRMTTKGPFAGKAIDVEIDDNSLLTLDFGDARFAYMDSSYCVAASLSPRMEIHGTEGTLTIVARADQPIGRTASREPELKLYRMATESWETIDVEPAPPVRDLGVLHVVECLREGTPLLLTGERGRHLVEVLAKAPIAAKEGRTLDVETTF